MQAVVGEELLRGVGGVIVFGVGAGVEPSDIVKALQNKTI